MEEEAKEFWAQIVSFVLTMMFLIHGCALLVLGIKVEVVVQDYQSIATFSAVPIVVVVILGIAMLAVSIIGLRSLYTGQMAVVKWFCYISLAMVLIELILGVLCAASGQWAAGEFTKSLYFNATTYRVDDSKVVVKSVDTLQADFECCGYQNFLEWRDNPNYQCALDGLTVCYLPDSCCSKEIAPDCFYSLTNKTELKSWYNGNAYGTGCWFAFTDWIGQIIDIGGIITLVLVPLQVICCLAVGWYVQHMSMKGTFSI